MPSEMYLQRYLVEVEIINIHTDHWLPQKYDSEIILLSIEAKHLKAAMNLWGQVTSSMCDACTCQHLLLYS